MIRLSSIGLQKAVCAGFTRSIHHHAVPVLYQGTHPSMVQNTTALFKELSLSRSRTEKRKTLKKMGPKRPMSAYFIFVSRMRDSIVEQNPDASAKEIAVLMGAKWRSLSEDQKRPYLEDAAARSEQYKREKAEYERSLPPKKPEGPFLKFLKDITPELEQQNPGMERLQLARLAGQKWQQLDHHSKEEYTQDYKRRLQQWDENYPTDN